MWNQDSTNQAITKREQGVGKQMSYMALFDKDVINEKFSSGKLLNELLNNQTYTIEKKKITLDKNEILFHEDKVHDYMYIIESGICAAWKQGYITGFLSKDEVVGMHDILGNEESSLTIQALTQVVVWQFTKKQVMSKLMYMQEGLFYLYHDIKMFNQGLLEKEMMQTVGTKEHLLTTLLKLGKRYGEPCEDGIKLPKIFTRRIISNYVGITSEHVSYLCRVFVKEGIIESHSNQIFITEANLEAACDMLSTMNPVNASTI
ncbi:Crp/Fnr family transcriptional regulator [Listeria booriae]|uniref:Crp/Fnr family transcriptional regulator n=1 Tax=Listeria booriae TaxID=1552123 RepID=A0A7X0Z3Q3_9LIST|nr:Crp/Fnr family transcriptional regulator [Listeria booriae]MBC2175396.1 Crp/Fnr family transcriptional regulator [Listeria booriae]